MRAVCMYAHSMRLAISCTWKNNVKYAVIASAFIAMIYAGAYLYIAMGIEPVIGLLPWILGMY